MQLHFCNIAVAQKSPWAKVRFAWPRSLASLRRPRITMTQLTLQILSNSRSRRSQSIYFVLNRSLNVFKGRNHINGFLWPRKDKNHDIMLFKDALVYLYRPQQVNSLNSSTHNKNNELHSYFHVQISRFRALGGPFKSFLHLNLFKSPCEHLLIPSWTRTAGVRSVYT